jgi:tRNA G10  N-methylase Trm11
MGIKKVIGSDISEKAIKDTITNTDWVIKKFHLEEIDYSATHKSATELSSFLEPESVDIIVTEPYLGPQRGEQKVKEVKAELEKLYSDSISEFKKVLKEEGRVVMLWPVFTTNKERKITNSKSSRTEAVHITPDYAGFKIINPIPKKLQDKIELTHRDTLIYGREGQRVWREIVILEKK